MSSTTVSTFHLSGIAFFTYMAFSTLLALLVTFADCSNMTEALALVALQHILLGGIIGYLEVLQAD